LPPGDCQREDHIPGTFCQASFADILPNIESFGDWDYFYIRGAIEWYKNTDGPKEDQFESVTVPAGFVSDLASVPRVFWSLIPKTGRYAYAAIVHDYLYWSQIRSRQEADRIFEIAMHDSKVPATVVYTLTSAVRLGGQSAWDTNSKLRGSGEKRVLKKFP